MILEHMKQFDCLWLEMGICGKFLDDRLEAVVQHVQDLFVDMVNDEKEHKLLLVSSIDGYQIELGKLSQELKEEPYQVNTARFYVITQRFIHRETKLQI